MLKIKQEDMDGFPPPARGTSNISLFAIPLDPNAVAARAERKTERANAYIE